MMSLFPWYRVAILNSLWLLQVFTCTESVFPFHIPNFSPWPFPRIGLIESVRPSQQPFLICTISLKWLNSRYASWASSSLLWNRCTGTKQGLVPIDVFGSLNTQSTSLKLWTFTGKYRNKLLSVVNSKLNVRLVYSRQIPVWFCSGMLEGAYQGNKVQPTFCSSILRTPI